MPIEANAQPSRSLTGRRLLGNVAWNFGGEVGRALTGLIATPILIYALGAQRYGMLVIIWAAIVSFSLFDLGICVALTKVVADRIGRKLEDEVPELVWTAMMTTIALGAIGGIVLWKVSPWLAGGAFKVPPKLRRETIDSLFLLAVALPLFVSVQELHATLAAFQRFDMIATLRGVGEWLAYLPMLVVLPFSRSLVPLVAVMMAGHAARWVVYLVLNLRVVPGLRGRPRFRWAALRELFSFGGWVALNQVGSSLIATCDRFFIGALVSAEALAFYAPALSVVRKIRMVPSLVSGVMMPAFSQGLAEDREKTERLFEPTEKFVLLAVFPMSLVVVAFAKPLMSLWLGAAIGAQGAPILRWLALGAFVSCLAEMPASMLLAAHRPDLNAKYLAASLLPSLALLWWLTSAYGAEGAAMARSLGLGASGVFLLAALSWVIPTISPVIRHYGWLMAAALVALALAALPMTIIASAVYVAGVLLAFAAHCWFRVFSMEERKFVIGALRLAPFSEAA
ncbi:MAG TPA: flippase [Candidatus Binataceae bacterium]|nr:flippase [Candidatus Binataceae bacterium]